MQASRQHSVSHLFSSKNGVAGVCRSVQQLIQARLELARDLLILLTVAVQLGEQVAITLSIGRNTYLGHPVLRRDPLWACRLFFFFSPSAAEYGLSGGQTQ